ncbi:putative G-protein coupled receptor [Apostichopus japonicus]|uniref:Putative G-protein coupled receptor n=1 Tax=Stichopus japonicus TaxID=307972 RepID=A0A2G8K3Y4_STIJA|nr:putative G-protein coupled receptor [Apostichopus japonicus]
MEREILFMDIINKISGENTTTEEVVIASETIAEISDDEDYLEDDPQRVELVISSLESVVSAGEASINITDPVVRTINSLMNLEQGFLDDGMIQGGRAVAALEGQIKNFQTLDGNFSTVLDNVGVTAVKIDARSVGSSLAYANIFPENETTLNVGALQEGSTRLFSDGDAMPLERTTTSISVPTTVLELLGEAGVKLTEVPVTFIIYGNDVLFRPSMPTEVEETIEEEDYSTVTERVASQIISAIIRTEDTNIVNLPPGSPVITTFLTNLRVRKGPVEVQVALYHITLIGSIISGLALIGCLIFFVSLKSFRSKQPTHIHINLCLSLLGFYISFLLNPLAVGKEILCAVASLFVHFFCLATLAWMSAEAMDMYYVFLKAERRAVRHFLPIACVLAYGLPAACALLVLFLDNSTDFQSVSYCFTHPGYALYFGFLTEVCAMFVFNFIIFIWVIRKILCRPLMVSKTAENAKRNEIIKRVRHAVLFWFVLGLSWIFGFLAAVDTKTLIFDYLYCFFISIQGILMFLLLCVANPAFRGMFRKTDSTQTKVTRQATTRNLPSSPLMSSSKSDIPMDRMDNPSSATKCLL